VSGAGATIIAALIGFIGGLVAARYTFRQKADELFLSGLQYLSGGSQNRNLGIAALGLAWESRRHRKHIAPLLVGSVIYLLLESKQDDAAHEIHNLWRLCELLLAAKNSGDLRLEDQESLFRAIDKKLQSGASNRPGLVLDATQLASWRTKIDTAS
jgi:hypothetical protein